jgi:hypothetical protein
MAASCPVGFDTKRLREKVSLVYARVSAVGSDGRRAIGFYRPTELEEV